MILNSLNVYVWDTPRRLMVAVAHDVNEARVLLVREFEYLDLHRDGLLNDPQGVTDIKAFCHTSER